MIYLTKRLAAHSVVSTLENDSNISEIDRIQTRAEDGTEPIQALEMPEKSISTEVPSARWKTTSNKPRLSDIPFLRKKKRNKGFGIRN